MKRSTNAAIESKIDNVEILSRREPVRSRKTELSARGHQGSHEGPARLDTHRSLDPGPGGSGFRNRRRSISFYLNGGGRINLFNLTSLKFPGLEKGRFDRTALVTLPEVLPSTLSSIGPNFSGHFPLSHYIIETLSLTPRSLDLWLRNLHASIFGSSSYFASSDENH